MGARIVWAVVTGFCLGVFVRSFVFLTSAMLGFIVCVGAAAFLVVLLQRESVRVAIFSLIVCVAFVTGALRMESAIPTSDSSLDGRVHTKVFIEGVVASEPDVRETSVRVRIDAHTLLIGSSTEPVRAGVLAVVPPHTDIAYGDVVRADGRLELPEPFDANEGRQFDYPMYLAKNGITYMLVSARAEATGESRGSFLQKAAIVAKQKFIAGLQAVLPEPEAGLAGGITVGDKRSVGNELTDTFKAVSLIHIIVLSGYNITIVINALRQVLVFFPRFVQYGGIASAVLFVVLMTGGAPSAVRAGIMSLIAVYARASARTFIAMRILGVVALGMIVWNPLYLAFDPGFQLSILATVGLVLFTEPISLRLHWIPEKFGLREIVASTIGTQLTVLPLLLYQNGLLSLVALPANLLALIVVPYAMFSSFVAAVGGMFVGSLAIPLAAPAYALLWYIIAVARLFAAFPFAAVSIPAFSAWWLLVAYSSLAILWVRIRIK